MNNIFIKEQLYSELIGHCSIYFFSENFSGSLRYDCKASDCSSVLAILASNRRPYVDPIFS